CGTWDNSLSGHWMF
nr:immunoglobulin light chain junction region [Macaca mulatta]MPN79744.1 immunoglobulin light chain junction region [Macaca mulatta]MPN79824.1 immunoglobulin light chain junction region [Macaca mulatta]MPN79866.1 immunoglobulin light chain junction region [Macaca mulatta]MPN79879.1 immunoglobulin light chain junction region [Macaca mulatta]